jgi:hypothetical protein
MNRTKFLIAMVSMLASTATYAHALIDPIAGSFGNGGLAWVQFLLITSGF